jgi:WD40 repeat protein
MSIIVQCDCGKKYQVGDDKAGKKLRCKACNGIVSIPKSEAAPADEWDDFGGGFDDFDDVGSAQPAAPRPRAKSGSRPKGKGKGKSKPGKSRGGMSPAVKYSLAGGIVAVTAGIVVAILYSRGVIGGGKKDGDDKVARNNGDDTSAPISGRASGRIKSDIKLLATTQVQSQTPVPQRLVYKLTVTKEGGAIQLIQGMVQGTGGNADGRQPAVKIKKDTGDLRDEVHRAVNNNNLKMIALAMHNYHDVHNSFPTPYRQGKGLGWRVHLLPFLEQQPLYRQFKLDEPWDSPHNRMLLSKMPEVFNAPGTRNDGKTPVHVFVGDGTPFGGPGFSYECRIDYDNGERKIDPDGRYVFHIGFNDARVVSSRFLQGEAEKTVAGKELIGKTSFTWPIRMTVGSNSGLRLRDITDGTDNTILAVVAGPETETEWTRPGGLPFVADSPASVMGTLPEKGFAAVTFSGRVVSIPPNTPPKTLAALIQHHDGQVVSLKDFASPSGRSPKGPGKPRWGKYVPRDRLFEAEFPSQVLERTSKTRGGNTLHVFLGGSGNAAFAVVYNTSPGFATLSDAQRLKTLESAVARVKFDAKKPVTILGKPALEIVGGAAGRQKLVMRWCIIGDRLYQLSVSGPKQNWDDRSVARFFNSFRAPAGARGGSGTQSTGGMPAKPADLKPPSKKPRTFAGHSDEVRRLAFRPDGKVFVSADSHGTIIWWNVADGKVLATRNTKRTVFGLAYSPDGKLLVSTDANKTITFWDAAAKAIRTVKSPDDCTNVTFPPGGQWFATGQLSHGKVVLYDSATGKAGKSLTGRQLGVLGAAVSPDGKTLASVGAFLVIVFDVATGRMTGTVANPGTLTNTDAAFCRNGKLLAVANDSKSVVLWDTASRRTAGALSGHDSSVECLCVSRNGNVLVTGGKGLTSSRSGIIQIWDVATRKNIAAWVPDVSQAIQDVKLSPDGKSLISATGNSVKLWDVSEFVGTSK